MEAPPSPRTMTYKAITAFRVAAEIDMGIHIDADSGYGDDSKQQDADSSQHGEWVSL